jgi:hypothetical protein
MKQGVSEDFPAAARELAERCIDACQRALGVTLDYSEESLAVLDHWLAEVPADKPELIELVAPMAGAYFGELSRQRLGGSWLMPGLDPGSWRVQLTGRALSWSPVAMAAEAIAGAEVEGHDATLRAGADAQLVADRLEQLPPVTEQEFYSLTGRLEALTAVADYLADLSRLDREDEVDGDGDDDDEDEAGPGDKPVKP